MYNIKSRRFVGERIRKRRKEMGLSQEGLAELIGITYQQLQRYENGSSQIGTDRLQAIALSLEVPITYFFRDEDPMVSESTSQYLSSEEERFLRYLRKIVKKEHKRSIFAFLKLAAGMGAKTSRE